MKQLWRDIAHLRTWSFGLAIATAIATTNPFTFLLCMVISIAVQSWHSRREHPEQFLASRTFLVAGVLATPLMALAIGWNWWLVPVILGTFLWDVGIHKLVHSMYQKTGLITVWVATIVFGLTFSVVVPGAMTLSDYIHHP